MGPSRELRFHDGVELPRPRVPDVRAPPRAKVGLFSSRQRLLPRRQRHERRRLHKPPHQRRVLRFQARDGGIQRRAALRGE